ncbi:hypothetical protein Poly51_32340 [Rubripirellula tenax]|uniref:3-keto-disaccharide hydrolase domain-containing protein n=1 Tax=Rubripirellula tenax TaxID=2528015 RepID=A0A5C6F0E2_9BACT|nr:hypothetical protein [Rubripirellula tenax]TWU54515.1 hypothetical protein Poly51_32340 [Rubripirellula tenax]
MPLRSPLVVLFLICGLSSPCFAQQSTAAHSASAVQIVDDFSRAEFPGRMLTRGNWTVADGKASVVFSDPLFQKFQDHGAMVSYRTPMNDAEVTIEFTPKNADVVVFTFDAEGGGHAFRIRLMGDERPSNAMTYSVNDGGEKPKPMVLNKMLPKLKQGEVNTLTVSLVGQQADFTVNGESFSVSDPLLARRKAITKLSIQHGDLEVTRFDVKSL